MGTVIPPVISSGSFLPPAALKRTLQLFCIDLSGTIHIGNELLSGTLEALQKLKDLNINYKFVTNTTKESTSITIDRLKGFGIPIQASDVYSTLSVTRDFIARKKLRPYFLIDDNAMEEFANIDTENPDSVVIGLAPDKLNYPKLNEAFRILLKNPSGLLVATHKGRYYKQPDTASLSLGPGPFVEALEYASGKKAIVVGKPNINFFSHVTSQNGVRPRTTIMIGDDVRDDIIGALNAGMNACLVKTGKYRDGDEGTLFVPVGETLPVRVGDRALVADSFADAVKMLT